MNNGMRFKAHIFMALLSVAAPICAWALPSVEPHALLDGSSSTNRFPATFRSAPAAFREFAGVDWNDAAARRKAIGSALTLADRFAVAARDDLMSALYRWRHGDELDARVKAKAGAFARLGELIADVRVMHNGDAAEGALSARFWSAPAMRALANAVCDRVDSGDRAGDLAIRGEPPPARRPAMPCTPANCRSTMLALAAAAEDALEDGAGTVQIAHFRKAITPEIGAKIGGYYPEQKSIAKHDDLYMTGLCVDDGRDKVLIVAFDLVGLDHGHLTEMRDACASVLGVPAANVLLTCSHTHEGPESARRINCPDKYSAAYCAQLTKTLEGEVKALAANGKWTRCHVYSNAIKVDINYNRRYVTSDGGASFMTHRREVRALCDGLADKELGLMLFYKVEGRETPDQPEYVIGNYAAHALAAHAPGLGGVRISADFPGVFRDYLREETGAESMFINGAAGDIVPKGDERGFAAAKALGETLGMAAIDAMIDAQRNPKRFVDATPRVGAELTEFVAPLRAIYRNLGATTYGWSDGNTHLAIQCVSIGDQAFAAIPGELCSNLGMEVKWHSPFKRTWVAELSTGYTGYISPAHSMVEGGYEPKKQIFHSRHTLSMITQLVDMLISIRNRTFPADAMREDPYPDCMDRPLVNIPEGMKLRNFNLR